MRWKFGDKLINHSDSKYRIDFEKPSKSKAQFRVKQFLKEYCENHILYEEYRIPKNLLYVDFLDATNKTAWEYQGVGHDSYNEHFHKNSRINFLSSIKRDMKKREILENNDFTVIELYFKDLPLLSPEFIKKNFNINIV